MKAVIQRVTKGKVIIEGKVKAQIGQGLMILLGIEQEDAQVDIDWLSQKIVNLRIFNDDNDVMNLSVKDINGDIILVSQFTLHASTKKGNRPSYIKAAKPDVAIPLYENFISSLEYSLGKNIQTGEFGAMMQLDFVNDGPVTVIIDSKQRV